MVYFMENPKNPIYEWMIKMGQPCMFRNWKDLLSLKLDQFLCPQDRIARYKQFKEFQKRIMAPRKGWGGIVKLPVFSNSLLCGMAKVR
jgi:hypothetical protein